MYMAYGAMKKEAGIVLDSVQAKSSIKTPNKK
jgi:hypothetical protein